MFDYSFFLKNISSDSPVGEDVRFTDEFSDIVEEVNKLSGTNWTSIVEKTSNLICNNSKDLQLALYYTYAKTAIDGFTGFTMGLGLVKELINKYQSAVYPLKKIGKRNILKIFKNDVFESLWEKPNNNLVNLELSLSYLNSIIDNYYLWEIEAEELVAIKLKLSQKLEQLKSTQDIKRDVITSKAISNFTDEQVSTSGINTQYTTLENVQSNRNLQPIDLNNTNITSQRELHDRLSSVIKYYEAEEDSVYLAFLIRKSTKWNEIKAYPVASQNNQTKLDAPRKDLITRVSTAYAQGQWFEVVLMAEEFFLEKANHLWFDLQFMEYNSLLKIGKIKDYELDYIFSPLKMLIKKFSEIPYYKFADGTPFASIPVQKWLENMVCATLQNPSAPIDLEVKSNNVSVVEVAQKIHFSQGTIEAAKYLQSEFGQSIFENLQIYYQLAKIAYQEKREELTKFYLLEIINRISSSDKLFWDVRFSKEILHFAYKVFSNNLSLVNEETLSLIKSMIIKIDPVYGFNWS